MTSRGSILQIGKYYPPHMGGIETHLELLSKKLSENWNVRALVSSDSPSTESEIVEGVPVTRCGTWFCLAGAPVCPRMSKMISNFNADIVHFHHPNPSGMISYLRSRSKAPLIVTYHSDIVRQKLTGGLFLPILYHALKRASLILATSPNYIDTSPVLLKFKSRCRIVPYGISNSIFELQDCKKAISIREQYGPRIVIGVGRLIYYKGFEYLIRAMKEIQGTLLIVGDGPLRKKLEKEAADWGVASKVVFAGEIQNSEIAPYYKAAKVFVLPSIARSEAFGIVQLEAMASGKAVVNTSLDSGVPWVSRDGETGITVPPKDPQALAKAINTLLDNESLCSRMGEAGIRRVRENFTVDVMVRKISESYEEALHQPPSGQLHEQSSEQMHTI